MTTGTIDFNTISELVNEMIRRNVDTIFPNKSIGAFRNKEIQEIIIDDEGTVFVLPVEDLDNPIMLPMFVDVCRIPS